MNLWREDESGLHRTFVFTDFAEAWAFMSKVAALAEEHNHHPDWSNSWNTVDITLVSHDKGCITDRDRRLAAAIDAL